MRRELRREEVEETEITSPLLGITYPPEDKFGLAWIIFAILGVGVLFPWDCFLTAYDFFSLMYPGFPFQFALSLAYNYPSIIALLLSVKFASRFSFTSRIVTAYAVDFLVLLFVPIVASVFSHKVSLWVILGEVFLTGCVTAILFGTVLGLAAMFPPRYIGAVMSGNGIAGLLTAGLRIVTKVSLPNTPEGTRTSSIIYFGLAAFTILICIVAYFVLLRLPIAKYYMKKQNNPSVEVNSNQEEYVSSEKPSLKSVFFKTWKEALTVFSVFFVTLALFPGVTSLITTKSDLGDWFQIILITMFMVFDFIGRTAPKWFRLFSPKTLWMPTFIRFAFFVLFVFCIKPKYFHEDWISYLLMAVFALTNGYLGTLAMMYGPVNVSENEKETAGTMMSFFLNFGIFVASHFAILMLYLINGSLPI